MKRYIQVLSLLLTLLAVQLNAQSNVQGTVEKVGNEARVSAMAASSTVSGNITNMLILLSFDDIYGPVTASVSTNYIGNLNWSVPTGYPTTIGGRKYFLFAGVDNGGGCCPQTLILNTPQKIIDVAFSGGNVPPAASTIRLSDLEGSTAPVTNNIWYVEMDGVDVTNYSNRFYATMNTGPVVNGPTEWYVETTGLVPLPVELKDITAKWTNDKKNAQVQWSTASEKDLDHFDIERSLSENADFTKVGEVKAAGNATTPKSYGFTDKSVGERSDRFYYRLRLMDKDGRFQYSPVVSLERETTFSFQVSPNPNNGLFFLTITSDFDNLENPTFAVTDIAGKLIKDGPVTDAKMQFDMTKSPKGVYFLSIRSAGREVKQYKVIKGEDK